METMQSVDTNEIFTNEDHFSETAAIPSRLIFGDLSRPAPRITIVIPAYKRTDGLRLALDSALEQTVSVDAFDVLVIDDDPTPDNDVDRLLSGYGNANLYYYKNEHNLGLYPNFNRCFTLARSPWVSMLHDDDLLYPDCLEQAFKAIGRLERFDLAMINPSYQEWDGAGAPPARASDGRSLRSRGRDLLKNVYYRAFRLKDLYYTVPGVGRGPTCGTLFRRDAVLALGGYKNTPYPEDVWFHMRLAQQYGCFATGAKWGVRRWESNVSTRPETIRCSVEASHRQLACFQSRYAFAKLDRLLFADAAQQWTFSFLVAVARQAGGASMDIAYPYPRRAGRLRVRMWSLMRGVRCLLAWAQWTLFGVHIGREI